ncbi:Tautomerase/MIF superfamily [Schizothecium vesticola]|uniref:L-dopachrome isomerase n=1 Tax=Schizothecium vesticola TaxID=314040 RepID=A0AA40BPZ1_9PEZI|nr:Tautomerase/MIF superfamily [Schizothecium vesticola]
MAGRLSNPSSAPRSAVPAKLSFSERKMRSEKNASMTVVEGNDLLRHIDRPLPGDVVRRKSRTGSKPDLAKRRSNINFFEEAFAINDHSPAKERVRGDAIVMAEVKTNVIIGDEFTFITELSYHLSTRYQRPVSSIVVTVHHGACMLFGGSFDAAYVLSIFALPSQLLPTTNKRNAALIQKHMKESLGVGADRGYVRFVPTREEDVAHRGKTMAGEIDELERALGAKKAAVETDGESTAVESIPKKTRSHRKLSVKSFSSFRPPTGVEGTTTELTPPASADETLPAIPASPGLSPKMQLAGLADKNVPSQSEGAKKARKKRSFVATIFSRSNSKSEYNPRLGVIKG